MPDSHYEDRFSLVGSELLALLRASFGLACNVDVVGEPDSLHSLAVANSVEGAAWVGVEALGGSGALGLPEALASRWCAEADRTMWRCLQFDAEREAVTEDMSKAGIASIPLKGAVIAPLYPDPRMRSMSDNDILYARVEKSPTGGLRVPGRTAFARACHTRETAFELQRIMVARGYETKGFLEWHHDEYHKPPMFNFEMHRGLVPPNSPMSGYWANPWSRGLRSSGNDAYAFRLSDEDVYLFHVSHAFEHYGRGGCGVRHLLDEIVLLRSFGVGLDWGFVHSELEKLGAREFEGEVRRASLAYLGDDRERARFAPERDWAAVCVDGFGFRALPEDEELASFMLGCGTYGREEVRLERAAEEGSGGLGARIRFAWKRLAMEPEGRSLEHPLLGSYRVLLPLFLLARLGKAAGRLPSVLREVKAISGNRNE